MTTTTTATAMPATFEAACFAGITRECQPANDEAAA
eukprot:CAMPEP_0205916150 /NCGR_PEP_ID=MMETSP1325-20131115/8319_1 /ASSEMBLY_ACC=CAM_ASM_000708 /TAXON_ID=236786 /ORGANISM="Florenciella sp., Strain RCC1007" /LENGTH=35 /DNA_ID= /DNA_START= /DNA_END= /DNA_ORIENTATION=